MLETKDTLTENIYTVSYRLIVLGTPTHWYEEKVRCIASDQYLAISRVSQWAMEVECIWHGNEEHKVPRGTRDVSITEVKLYAEDVGEMSGLCHEVFPEE